MKPWDPGTLTRSRLEALTHASTAGAKLAAGALARLTGWTLDVSGPMVRSMGPDDIPPLMGGAETERVGLHLGIRGEARGEILIALEPISAHRILDALLPGTPARASLAEMSEMEESALREAGNIMGAAYLGAMGFAIGRALTPTVPELAIDMTGALLDDLLARTGRGAASALVIEAEFRARDRRARAHLLHLPDSGSLPGMLAALESGSSARPSYDPSGV